MVQEFIDKFTSRVHEVFLKKGILNFVKLKPINYLTARASREMLFRCFALENPDLRVLQYDPGFVLTDMLDEYIEINKDFKDANGEQFVTPETTARRLVAIVHDNSFTNAARVKYEDFN